MPWRARGVRSVLLRRRARRPQLKRDPLGGSTAALNRGHMYPASRGLRRRLATTLLITVLCGSACQAWRTERIAPDSLLTRHATKLRVIRTDGTQIVLEHPVLRGDTLSGTRPRWTGQDEVRIPLTHVRQVATRGFSAGRTIGLGVGVAALAFGAFLIGVVACDPGCH